MRIERFDPERDAERTRACHEIYLAGAPVDDPHRPRMSPRAFAGWLSLGWSEDPSQTWLARDPVDGERLGWHRLTLPEREDRRVARLDLVVSPRWRRRGVGGTLLRHAAAQADRLGRTVLSGEAREDAPGDGFARALGARPGLTEVHRVLTLSDIPAGHLAGLRERAAAAARGYLLDAWTGPVPQQHLTALAAVYQAGNDAPRDADRQPAVWDTDRVRQAERRISAQGLRYYTVVAFHGESGELAALTQLGVDPLNPGWAFQELTAVAGPHRGHRLGLLIKLEMLELLAVHEPRLARVITGNAASNKHMIAVNTELGFRPVDRWRSWELPTAAALAARPAAARQS